MGIAKRLKEIFDVIDAISVGEVAMLKKRVTK
jgi:hypothetical protein